MSRLRIFLVSVLAAAFVGAPAFAGMSTIAEEAIVMNADTGQVLWEKNGYKPMPPASMSKLMTLELLFQRLKDGRVKLTDTFFVSERAWRTPGSRMFLNVGSQVTVENLIRGIIIQSGNDACMTVAEALGGSVENFADMMNKRARELGLKNSRFVNPDGLPDPAGQTMSAYDLAVLARHLAKDYPAYYHFFSEPTFTWNNIQQHNRNLVLAKFRGADGLKTGHTDDAGYGVTASAKVNGQRLIVVLNGLRYPDLDKASDKQRDYLAEIRRAEEAARVFSMAFREFKAYTLFKPGDAVDTVDVWGGAKRKLAVTVREPATIMLEPEVRAKMKVAVRYFGPLKAPIAKGQRVGALRVTVPGRQATDIPVYAAEDVGKAGLIGKMWMGVVGLWNRLFKR